MPARGDRVGDRYVLERTVGSGGMGQVWVARDERLAREVAIKVVLAERLGDEVARARLLREARVAAQLQHPGIVQVYDVGETEAGDAFLAMELVRGRSPRELMKLGELGPERARAIVVETARALGAAHAAGLVHRDVKPENLLVRDDGRVALLDFGLARLAVQASNVLTTEGAVVGTPAYLAPEQAYGRGIDHRVDQFALGVTAYELLTGRLPWTADSITGVLAQILTMDPDPPSHVAPGLPQALDAVLLRALAKEPEARYPDIEAFARALLEVGPLADDRADGGARPAPQSNTPAGDSASLPFAVTAAAARATTERPREPSPSQPVAHPASSRSARRWIALPAAAVLSAAAAGTWALARAPTTDAAPVASVMASPRARLACPLAATTGFGAGHRTTSDMRTDVGPWMAAAAAQAACRRARWVLGGNAARVLGPAELLSLPRQPADAFAAEPFGGDARTRSVRAARAQADAYLDGRVWRGDGSLHVVYVLRDRRGRQLARAVGAATALGDAARRAIDRLVSVGALPAAPLDADAAQAFGVRTTAAGLALEEVLVMNGTGPAMRAACERAESLAREMGPAWRFVAPRCAKVRARSLPAAAAPDRSSATSYAWTAAARIESGDESHASELADALDVQTDVAVVGSVRRALRALLLRAAGRTEEAQRVALRAVQLDPESALAWEVAGVATPNDQVAAYNAAATAWQPDFIAQSARHAYELAPGAFKGSFTYASVLLRSGRRQDALGIAAEVGDVDGSAAASVIFARVDASHARFGRAARRLEEAIGAMRGPMGAEHADYYKVWWGLWIAEVIGSEAQVADLVATRFILAEPPRLVPYADNFPALYAITCALATQDVARRCIRRLGELVRSGYFSGEPGAHLTELLAGVERLAAGDRAGAARALSPLSASDYFHRFRGRAFELLGEDERSALADRPTLASDAGDLGGASMSHVREARRALRRGDAARAAELARRVVDAWSTADAPVPAVDEMRALLRSTDLRAVAASRAPTLGR